MRVFLSISVLLLVAACAHKDTVKTPPPPSPAAKPVDLTGAPFTLSAITVKGKEIPIPPIRRPTMQFAEGNRVSGLAGVNRYSSQITLAGKNGLAFGPAIATKMAGPPEAMTLESGFLDAISTVNRFELDGGKLKLTSTDGATRLELTR